MERQNQHHRDGENESDMRTNLKRYVGGEVAAEVAVGFHSNLDAKVNKHTQDKR